MFYVIYKLRLQKVEIKENEKNLISRAEDIVTEDAKVRKSQPDKPIHR